jgi:hypothetical protein
MTEDPTSKRPPGRLPGSSELFRDTRREAAREPISGPIAIDVTAVELKLIIEALQLARFPELHRVRPTMTQFEDLGKLQDRLRKLLGESQPPPAPLPPA